MTEQSFRCSSCGGEIAFRPGTTDLECPYCGTRQAVSVADTTVEELDYHAALAARAGTEPLEERLTVRCSACAAETTFDASVTAADCPFCGTNLVLTGLSSRLIRPHAVLPFAIDRKAALAAFRRWVSSRWFAPSALRRLASAASGLVGVYIPHWTYDCRTTSSYVGERGDDYTTTESYTAKVNGRSAPRTRQVTHTRWRPAAGVVEATHDDVLVRASASLPDAHADRLEPWDLEQLAAYRDDYLAGFRAESYTVDLEQGFERARTVVDARVHALVCRDIGGDRQRVHRVDTDYRDITFKHVLLPVWVAAYRFNDRVFRFLVNARTGEVQGERPWSWVKITLAVLAALAVVTVIILAQG